MISYLYKFKHLSFNIKFIDRNKLLFDQSNKCIYKLRSNKRTYCSKFTVIYTDGSCKNNGKIGSTAGIGVFFGENDERNLSEKLPGPVQTNQRAELYVCIAIIIVLFLI